MAAVIAAPGPMSTTQSAARIVSSSCSTTMSVLPRSRSATSVSIRRRLSRWCRPIDGSSSTYSTPVRPEPIWVARRMRCASPPDRVAGRAVQVEVAEPDLDEEVEPHLVISRSTWAAIFASRSVSCSSPRSLRVAEAQLRGVRDAPAVHEHREHLGLEALAVAHRTRHLAQVFGPARALRVGLGLQVLPLDVRHDALEAGGVRHLAPVAVLPPHLDLEVVAVEHGVLHLVVQLLPRCLQGELQIASEALEQPLVVVEESLALGRPRDDDALGDASARRRRAAAAHPPTCACRGPSTPGRRRRER